MPHTLQPHSTRCVLLTAGSSHNMRIRVATLGFSAAAACLPVCVQGTAATATPAELINRSQRWVEQNLPGFLSLLQKQGWQLDKLYLPRPEWTAQW